MQASEAAAVSAASAAVQAVSAASQVPRTGLGLILDKVEYFIMVPLIYLSLAFFVVAVIAKIVKVFRSPPPPYQLAIYPIKRKPMLAALGDAFGMGVMRKKNPVFWFFLIMYHLGFLLLILGHLDLFPAIPLVASQSRHMVGAGAVGLMVTVPTFYFLARRFRGIDRQISVPSDYLLLLLLVFTFLLGDLMSWGNSWTPNGFVMTKADFKLYFGSLASFSFADPRQFLHGSHYHFIVLHVLLASCVFITLPFSKVVHAFFSIPLNALRRKPWTRN